MPVYNNLVELVFFDSSVDLDCEAVLNLLQGSPCLQNLEFWGVNSPDLHCLLSCICSILLLIFNNG